MKVAIDNSRRIVAMGTMVHTATGRQAIIVARFTSAGVLDTTFNATGRRIFNYNGSLSDFGSGLAIDASGRIVVAGDTTTNGVTRGLIARLTAAGAWDTTLGTTGRVRTAEAAYREDATSPSTGPTTTPSRGDSLNPDTTNLNDVFVARLLPSGAYDNTFGGHGRVTTTLLDEADVHAEGVRSSQATSSHPRSWSWAGCMRTRPRSWPRSATTWMVRSSPPGGAEAS